jgi:hypothetical protein
MRESSSVRTEQIILCSQALAAGHHGMCLMQAVLGSTVYAAAEVQAEPVHLAGNAVALINN